MRAGRARLQYTLCTCEWTEITQQRKCIVWGIKQKTLKTWAKKPTNCYSCHFFSRVKVLKHKNQSMN